MGSGDTVPELQVPHRKWRLLPIFLAAALMLASAWFGAALQADYAHMQQALSPLVAKSSRMVPWIGVGLFLLPGLLLSCHAWRARADLPADCAFGIRLAWQMLLLAGGSFALQGILPFETGKLPDADENRLHVVAGMLCWLCVWLSSLCVALTHGIRPVLRLLAITIALLLPFLLLLAPPLVGGGLAQRLAIAVWLGWCMQLDTIR